MVNNKQPIDAYVGFSAGQSRQITHVLIENEKYENLTELLWLKLR